MFWHLVFVYNMVRTPGMVFLGRPHVLTSSWLEDGQPRPIKFIFLVYGSERPYVSPINNCFSFSKWCLEF